MSVWLGVQHHRPLLKRRHRCENRILLVTLKSGIALKNLSQGDHSGFVDFKTNVVF